MSNRNIGVYILFKADTASAKAGATEVAAAVAGVTEATERQERAATRNTAARQSEAKAVRELAEAERQARDAALAAVIGSTPAGMRQAAITASAPLAQLPESSASTAQASGIEALDAAFRSASLGSDRLSASVARTTTAFGPAQAAVARMTLSMRDQTAALLEEQQASAAWQNRQDAIRAQFNPLFAASRQYEMQLRAIAEAERDGAISATEALSARERAASILEPIADRADPARRTTHYAGQLTYQLNDIAMMTAMGQSPMMLMLQQGPQVTQVLDDMRRRGIALGPAIAGAFTSMLNPMSLATMAIIAFSAVGVQGLMKLKGETKTFANHLEDLDAIITRMKANLDRVGNIRLGETFGDLKPQAQELARLMLQIDREGEFKSISGIAAHLRNDAAKPNIFDRAMAGISRGAVARSSMPDEIARPVDVNIERYKKLGAANSYEDFVTRTAAIEELAKAGNIKGVVADLVALKSAMTADGAVTGMSKELRKLLGELAEAAFKTAELEAAWNGTAKAEAISRQVGQMDLDWTQQAELSRVIALHGEQSAEAEATRAAHARAALEAQLKEMGAASDSDDARRARAALEEKLAADREASEAARIRAEQSLLDDLARQEELSTTILKYGEDSAEVEAVKAEHARQTLRTRLEEAHMLPGLVDLAVRLTAAEQERAAAIKAAAGARSADRMMAELRDQAAINAAKVAFGEDSIAVKELEIAAERRLFEEGLKTLQVSEARKRELRQQWELTNGLASADPFGRLASARGRDQNHAEALARLELELRLVGQTSAARSKALAVHDAEVRMRREGYDLGSREIEIEKRRAAGIADLTTELERQQDAWEKVHQAAEGMIDGPIDALLNGDVKGALAAFAKEFLGLYAELAWKNPLKNRMLGTNYATLDDVGGFGGLIGRMFGGPQAEPLALSGAAAMSPRSMAVTTPMVNISTSGLSGIPLAAGLQPAANAPWAPGGPSIAAAQLQSVSVGGALRADALTGLNGPFAAQLAAMVAEAQQVFGEGAVRVTSAFRSIERQQELWAEALQKYGSAAEARKWVAPPGSSNHNFGLAADLKFGSSAVQQWFHQQAPRFGLGFPMSWEPWHIEQTDAKSARSAALPVAQLERLATSAELATGQLGTFGARAETTGQGLVSIGSTFAQALQMFGASKGPGGMIAATLLGGLFKGIGIPGFDRGGWTGAGSPSEVAGLVHAGEYVFDAAATAKIGVPALEAIRRGTMRGYQAGGHVTGGRPAVPAAQRSALASAVARAPAEQRHVFEMNVSGTGNAEIAAAVRAAISAAFDEYDRNVFAGRVRMVVNDDWAA